MPIASSPPTSACLPTTLAGFKIEAWRLQNVPKLTRRAAAERIGLISEAAIQAYERYGKIANGDVVRRIDEMGIAAKADWFEKSEIFTAADLGGAGVCAHCDRGAIDGRNCGDAGCPYQIDEKAREKAA